MEKLNALRKQKIRAVILLEAVVALAIFASITTLLLGQIQKNRQEEAKILQKEEVLRVAKMALQTGQNQVKINGAEIQVFSSEKGLEVYHGSEQLLAIKEP
ncbi:competence type IV pilus minor pilin ComGE [Streptococcus gwangjuensis]|uniref:competence type IV pilus minor pilin ComGE n=1 Tax=Streptococcus gwangjuensis TaxID=1433513 RepID=UPI002482BFA2|nr:competence type IV pilus minor pilin ComGE [Streptococcus gwangjuense]